MAVYENQTINGWWKVDKSLVRIFECHITVIVLQELIFQKYKHADQDGWFFFQVERLEEICLISRHVRRKCFSILESFGILEVEKRGIPCKFYYRVHGERIDQLISSCPTTEVKSYPTGQVKSDPTGQVKSDPTYIRSDIKKLNKEVIVEDSEASLTESTTTNSPSSDSDKIKTLINSIMYFKRLKAAGALTRVIRHYGSFIAFEANYLRLYADYCAKKRYPGKGGDAEEKWYHDCYECIENKILKEVRS